MIKLDTTRSAKPFGLELNEQDLDKVTGGDGKNTTTKNTGPNESMSLNFSEVKFTYTRQ